MEGFRKSDNIAMWNYYNFMVQEYAFCVSDYPIILSLENHCNEAQQVRLIASISKDLHI